MSWQRDGEIGKEVDAADEEARQHKYLNRKVKEVASVVMHSPRRLQGRERGMVIAWASGGRVFFIPRPLETPSLTFPSSVSPSAKRRDAVGGNPLGSFVVRSSVSPLLPLGEAAVDRSATATRKLVLSFRTWRRTSDGPWFWFSSYTADFI